MANLPKTPDNRLRELREGRGEKVIDLVPVVRKDTSIIRRYESGDVGMSTEVLSLLAEHYGVTMEHLLGRDREAVA